MVRWRGGWLPFPLARPFASVQLAGRPQRHRKGGLTPRQEPLRPRRSRLTVGQWVSGWQGDGGNDPFSVIVFWRRESSGGEGRGCGDTDSQPPSATSNQILVQALVSRSREHTHATWRTYRKRRRVYTPFENLCTTIRSCGREDCPRPSLHATPAKHSLLWGCHLWSCPPSYGGRPRDCSTTRRASPPCQKTLRMPCVGERSWPFGAVVLQSTCEPSGAHAVHTHVTKKRRPEVP